MKCITLLLSIVVVLLGACGDDGGGSDGLPSVELVEIANIGQMRQGDVANGVLVPSTYYEPTGRYAVLADLTDGETKVIDIQSGEVFGGCPELINGSAGRPFTLDSNEQSGFATFGSAAFRVQDGIYEGLHRDAILRCQLGGADTQGTLLEMVPYEDNLRPAGLGIATTNGFTDGEQTWSYDGSSAAVGFDFTGLTKQSLSIKRDRTGFWSVHQDDSTREIVVLSVEADASVTEVSRYTPGIALPNVQVKDSHLTFNSPTGCLNVDMKRGLEFDNPNGCGDESFFTDDGLALIGPGPFNGAVNRSYVSYLPIDGGTVVEHVHPHVLPTPGGYTVVVDVEAEDVYVWSTPSNIASNERPDNALHFSLPCLTDGCSLQDSALLGTYYDNGACALRVEATRLGNGLESSATPTVSFPCDDHALATISELGRPFQTHTGQGSSPFAERRPIIFHHGAVEYDGEKYNAPSAFYLKEEGALLPLWRVEQVRGVISRAGYRYDQTLGFGFEGEVYRVESPY